MTQTLTVDVAFPLRGDALPLDHGYPLFGAVSRLIPRLHQEPKWGIHPVYGRRTGLWDGPDEYVKLRFLGSAARIIAEQLRPSQSLERHSDGTITVSFKMPVSPAIRQCECVRGSATAWSSCHPQLCWLNADPPCHTLPIELHPSPT